MHGDFSLNPLNYRDRVSRVLYQMGRVQLESDVNEQTETTLRFLRGLAMDVIGFHGGLAGGFKILPEGGAAQKSFRIGWGEYYVDGIRCRNYPFADFWDVIGEPAELKKFGDGQLITEHADSFWDADATITAPQLLYLAVWERHLSSVERDEIREVALGGPDTASRAEIVWQIRRLDAQPILAHAKQIKAQLTPPVGSDLADVIKIDPLYIALNLRLRSSGRLKAFAKENQDLNPCVISPEARYRGEENRLYRVEIHKGGEVGVATFKWSHDNASIVYPVREIEGTTVFLESLGRDDRTAIHKNNWVEVVDDRITLTRQINKLVQVVDVNRHRLTVSLSEEPENNAGDKNRNPILRRWAEEPRVVKAGTDLDLDDGVKVQFSIDTPPNGLFRAGDYWLIPARAATGGLIWPGGNTPEALRPHGIDEHYAPLCVFDPNATTPAGRFKDFRWRFGSMADPVTPLP